MTDLSVAKKLVAYKPKNKVRFVTAAALFGRRASHQHHAADSSIHRLRGDSPRAQPFGGQIVNAALQEGRAGHCDHLLPGVVTWSSSSITIDLLRQNGGGEHQGFRWRRRDRAGRRSRNSTTTASPASIRRKTVRCWACRA